MYISNVASLDRQIVIRRVASNTKGSYLWHFVPPLVLFLTLLGQLSIRVSLIESGYQLEQVRQQALKNDSQLRQLYLERAYLVRPSNLVQQAKNKLKMSALTPQQIRHLVDINEK